MSTARDPVQDSATLTCTPRVSGGNCAKIYNNQTDNTAKRWPAHWPFSRQVQTAHVWDAFVIYGLLRDHINRKVPLMVPHHGEQRKRFEAAMKERNDRHQRYGFPQRLHQCNKCTRQWDFGQGRGMGECNPTRRRRTYLTAGAYRNNLRGGH